MEQSEQLKQSRVALAIAALGVVYGDIGTSPLYAEKEVFNPSHGIPFSVANVLGGVSAIFWALMLIVTLKYVILILRADNKGEGGIMALLALASVSVKERAKWGIYLALIGIFGAALFYGDGVITPAISVLSAIEGLEVAAPALKSYVVPLTVIVLIALFAFQRKGTAAVGALFGPVMMLWFATLAVSGIFNILRAPDVLAALNPFHALDFLTGHGLASFVVLGAVFLAVTGAEALYADMGHFGKSAVRQAWFWLVFPSLALNYFGQGALLIANPKALENPFYLMFPEWALYPMVILSTVATVIASQAVISGTYSITKQAIQLGFLPRTRIIHTSAKEIGQIYVPNLNRMLLIAIIAAVILFGSSTNLASAYGLAVSGTMLITTLLTFFVVRYGWHYNLLLSILATGFFLLIDTAFFSANLIKLIEGGWFPLTMGAFIFIIMTTWRRGREILFHRLRSESIPLESFMQSLFTDPPQRVPGTAVFLTGTPEAVPHAMLHNLAHNKVIHERIVFLTVVIREQPWVPIHERIAVEPLEHNCYRIKLYFGFQDRLDVPKALEACKDCGLVFTMLETSFFVSRETVIPTLGHEMSLWRERLFATMTRNASGIVEYFHIPVNRVIELGTRIEI
ncbi:MAG TPA: potassium transporter Kup [Burkholderiales bacterium]|nr:potassium transporter Kup [Burkholderiales bacterium]